MQYESIAMVSLKWCNVEVALKQWSNVALDASDTRSDKLSYRPGTKKCSWIPSLWLCHYSGCILTEFHSDNIKFQSLLNRDGLDTGGKAVHLLMKSSKQPSHTGTPLNLDPYNALCPCY